MGQVTIYLDDEIEIRSSDNSMCLSKTNGLLHPNFVHNVHK